MLDRIREILSARQLSPTQFADTIGVSRPIVSHILSGRNKPSLEVVQKIIAAFPGISLPWLLSGIGSMEAKELNKAPNEAAAKPVPALEQTIPPQSTESPPRSRKQPAERLDAGANSTMSSSAGLQAPSPPSIIASVSPPDTTTLPTAPASLPSHLVPPKPMSDTVAFAQALAEPGKKIRRIVIFYHDGTFSDYQPE